MSNFSRMSFAPALFRFLLGAALLLPLGSCGGGDSSPESGGRKKVVISHFWADVQDVWEEAIVEFEKAHPDIDIVQQAVSFDVHYKKVLTTAAAGSDIGDLVLLEDWFAQELLERQFLVDIGPWIQRDLKAEDFYQVSLDTYTKEGTVQAFPVALGTYPLYYNRDLFDSAGVRYPDSTWTYDTLLAAAKKLTRDTDGDGRIDQYGFLLDNSGGFDGLLYSMGGAVLTPDGTRSAFAQPATQKALQYWVDLVQTHKVAPVNASVMGGSSSGGSRRPFETGRFAMAMLQSAISTWRTVPFKWDLALPPSGPAGRKALRYGAAFGIPKTSENPEAAWEFIRWIVKEMPPRFADRMFYGQVPNSRRLASSQEYLGGDPKVNRQVVIDMIEKYSFSYWRSHWLEFRDQGFLPELDLMVAGKKSVAEGATAASARIDEVLQQ
jgi:multiple sugar transport system substrate-binding protein